MMTFTPTTGDGTNDAPNKHFLTLRAALDIDLAPACHKALDALRAGG